MTTEPNIAFIFAVNSAVIAIVVLIHYESLYLLTRLIKKTQVHHRYRILLGVFGAIIAHAVEIWIFALAYFLMHHANGWGELTGNNTGTYFDCVYYSFSTFSTLGYGDIVPEGPIRYLTGLESLTGLVLIAWSSSFLFLDMQRYWGIKEEEPGNQ